MKKLLLILLCFPLFFSCSKECKECLGNGMAEEVCRDDFDSNEQYNAYIQVIEDLGGSCK